MACLLPLLLDFSRAFCRFTLRVLNLLCAFHECLDFAIFENLAFSVHFADSGIFLLRIVVNDGLSATRLLISGENLAGLSLGQVPDNLAHLTEELVLLLMVKVDRQLGGRLEE